MGFALRKVESEAPVGEERLPIRPPDADWYRAQAATESHPDRKRFLIGKADQIDKQVMPWRVIKGTRTETRGNLRTILR